MAGSMPSEQVELLIAGYVLGDLDLAEAEEFERLLADNPAIAAEVTRMQQSLEVSFGLSDDHPPAHLRAKILDANASATTSLAAPPTSRSRRRLQWGKPLGAVAAVLIVALAINNYRLWQALQTTPPQPSNSLTYTLQGTEKARTAAATVVVNPSSLDGTLTIKNLPALPPGKVYVLWTVLKQGAPFTVDAKNAILTEVVAVDAQGNVDQTITVPEVYRSSELVAKVAVTIEDANAPQTHQGSPVMITGL